MGILLALGIILLFFAILFYFPPVLDSIKSYMEKQFTFDTYVYAHRVIMGTICLIVGLVLIALYLHYEVKLY